MMRPLQRLKGWLNLILFADVEFELRLFGSYSCLAEAGFEPA